MKDKILQALKTKFKNLGFGDKAFQGVADYLAATVTEEAQIETAIAGVEPLLKSFQGEIDARVTTAVAKAKSEKKDGDDDGEGAGQKKKTEPKDKDDIAVIVAEAVKSAIAPIQQELSVFKGQKTLETRKQTLEAKLKDAPEKIKAKILKDFGRMNFEKDEDFDAYLTETETDLAEFNQELANQNLGAHGRPQRGSATTEKEGVDLAKKVAETKNANKSDGIVGKEI